MFIRRLFGRDTPLLHLLGCLMANHAKLWAGTSLVGGFSHVWLVGWIVEFELMCWICRFFLLFFRAAWRVGLPELAKSRLEGDT